MPRRLLIRGAIAIGVAAAGIGVGVAAASRTTGLPASRVVEQTVRIVAAQVGRVVYRADLETARELAKVRGHVPDDPDVPVFVFERPDAPHLVALRTKYRLNEVVAGAKSEYEAQLKLAEWVGTRYEHGTDDPPGGRQVCDPVAVIESGARGARYWCEVAAYTMIHAAQSLGWPARMITGSTDGYTWEHAVAELWSSEHRKWYVVDADFNVVFEADGVPLSAWELVHDGPALKERGKLVIRRFAKLKEGLHPQDLLRFFTYVHVHYRTDWCTRPLRRASPAGGDLNARWTAREGNGPVVPSIPRAKTPREFETLPIFSRRSDAGESR
jgi:hypothetical protein